MGHKEISLIELTCDAINCSSKTIVENYCRPAGWMFLTLQNNQFTGPLHIHFCPGCCFKFKIILHQHNWIISDAKEKT